MALDVARILIEESEVPDYVRGLATRVNKVLDDDAKDHDAPVVVLGLLNGALFLTTDFVRQLARIRPGITYECMIASSYRKAVTSYGLVSLVHRTRSDFDEAVAGSRIVLVDDIIDTGGTMAFTIKYLCELGVKSIVPCALLANDCALVLEDPPYRHPGTTLYAPVIGKEIELEEGEFVLGYGMGLGDQYRTVPFVYTTIVKGKE